MLRIDQLRLLPDEPEDVLLHKCARLLRTDPSALTGLTVLRRAIDAREGLTFVYTVAVSAPQEAALLRRCRDKRVTAYTPEQYALPAPVSPPEVRPIVVGAGPAGLFAALVLAKCGARPILLERGQCVEQRQRDVQCFWATGGHQGRLRAADQVAHRQDHRVPVLSKSIFHTAITHARIAEFL